MNVLAALFPRWAYNRQLFRQALELQQRYYDAARPSDQRPRRGSGASGDAVVGHAGSRLRESARYYDENTDYAVAVLDDLVNMVVGEGVHIEPMVKTRSGQTDRAVCDQIRDLYARFWERPEVSGEYGGPELERLVTRSIFRDGEVFGVHHLARPAPFPTVVPYVLELLEADFCPFDLIDRGGDVTHGIERDAWGRPRRYFFYKQHPGSASLARSGAYDLKAVPAERVLHPRIAKRLGQVRGVSVLHAVLSRIDDAKETEENERIAAKLAAAWCAVITKADLPGAHQTTSGDRSFRMRPGMIFDKLQPGERVEILDSKRPNAQLAEFLKFQIRRLAAGTGARYSSIARDYNGTYSAQRQELVETRTAVRRYLTFLVSEFYRPIRREFLAQAVLSGALRISRDTDVNTLVDAEYRGPAMPWIDPVKEMQGYTLAVQSGFMSRPMVIRDLGNDPDIVDRQRAQDTAAPTAQPAPGAGDDDGDDDDDNADNRTRTEIEHAA